ncbi:MAG: NUDIX domain-containing protein [Bacteroidota bacterium]|nr:NUDIX domain-containing protein [Bacteroidota bacterium]
MKRKIIAAGGLVSNNRNELLMIFRRGKWDLPKGKLDEGESIEVCAVREVEEETGITNIALGKLIDITYHHYFDEWISEEVTKETHWFAMKILDDQKLIPQTTEGISEIKWVNETEMNECLQNTYQNIIDIIDKWKKL